MTSSEPDWVVWARRLRAIAQTGLEFAPSEYDRERYREILQIAEDIFARHTLVEHPQIRDFFAFDVTSYATPQIDVRGGIFDADKVLLVRERLDGLWTLPGGYADVNTSPREAVEREIFEESGYRARAVKLAMLYDKRFHGHPPSPRHSYKAFFLCERTGGEPRTSYETTDIRFFPVTDLPDLSLPRVTASQIQRLYEHHLRRDLPTDFD